MTLRSIGLWAALLCSPLAFADEIGDAERRLHEDLALQAYAVGYKDAQGTRIEFEAFDEAVRDGRSFTNTATRPRRSRYSRSTTTTIASTSDTAMP